MFGKLMHNFYYGKSGQGDYTPEDLPRTRLQLFFEMLRIRLGALCKLNLIYMLPWLPAMLVAGMLMMYVVTMGMAPTEERTITAEDGTVTTETVQVEMTEEETLALLDQQVEQLPQVLNLALLLLIPCIAITGPWTAGVCYVTRNWARDEHAFLWEDMKDAMKENWKMALGLSTITGAMPFLVWTSWRVYGELAASNGLLLIPQTVVVILGAVWMLTITYAYPMLVTYNVSFVSLLKNSLMLALGSLPKSLGVRLLHCVPVVLGVVLTFLLGNLWVPLMLLGYYVVIGFALSRFVTASFTNAQFDKYINSHIEGAQVNRGLAPEEDEGADEEETRELKPWENGYASRDN